jgi:hypothetical protein
MRTIGFSGINSGSHSEADEKIRDRSALLTEAFESLPSGAWREAGASFESPECFKTRKNLFLAGEARDWQNGPCG